MIILDTNVLSALMRRASEETVVSWLDRQPPLSIWTTTITVFEVRLGLELLAPGRRRRQLEAAFGEVLKQDLDGRVLPFETPAAEAAGIMAARQQRAGRPLDVRDLQIAGIAAWRRAVVATRNIRHFADLGIELVDPWVSE